MMEWAPESIPVYASGSGHGGDPGSHMTTKVALLEDIGETGPAFRAVARGNQSMGRTAGEALDALTPRLAGEEADTLIIVRKLRPDQFFTAQQQARLEELMTKWREARGVGICLSPGDQAELERLVDAELRAATERAAAISQDLGH